MKWGIKHQVLLLALVPTISLSVLLVTYFINTRLQDLEDNLRSQGSTIATRFAHAGQYGVFSHNKHLLQKLAISSLLEHETEGLAFYSVSGDQIAAAGKFTTGFEPPSEAMLKKTPIVIEKTPEAMVFVLPITLLKENNHSRPGSSQAETLIGWLKLELETHSIASKQMHILLNSGLIFLLGLSISIYYALHIGSTISRPISELASIVEKIKKGDLIPHLKASNYKEIQVLDSGIHTMAQALANAHEELQKKVDQATLSLRRTLETIEVQNIELDISRRVAENANRVKSEFLADMSHEIRTPLSGVIGFINLLQKTELNLQQQEYVTTIQKTTRNLLTILNDVLDFSKIEAGKLRFQHTPMDLRFCVNEILELFAAHAHEKSISLTPLIYTEIPALVLADPLRIKQIITNLISNAIKFTEKGTVLVQAMLEQETLSHLTIRINVTDMGVGISPEEQKFLFQAFNQPKADPTQKFGGTGLGLTISKKLVEQMGGKIGVQSKTNEGTTFWFTFQAEKYLNNKTLFTGISSIRGTNKKSNVDLHSPPPLFIDPKLQILIVDDNLENLKVLQILLEQMNIQPKAVTNGEDAIALVEKQNFQLIFMDIRMPNMTGLEATKKIREIEAKQNRPQTPIIALTANTFPEEKKAVITAGMNDYLLKPIEEITLKSILHHYSQSPKKLKAIDWELGQKLAGHQLALAIELMEKLIHDLKQEKENINRIFDSMDWNRLRDEVHKLHGACCYCGVPELKNATQSLEKATQTQSAKLIKPYLEAFNSAIDTLLTEFQKAPPLQ